MAEVLADSRAYNVGTGLEQAAHDSRIRLGGPGGDSVGPVKHGDSGDGNVVLEAYGFSLQHAISRPFDEELMGPGVAEHVFFCGGADDILARKSLQIRRGLIVRQGVDVIRTVVNGSKEFVEVIRIPVVNFNSNLAQEPFHLSLANRISS